MNVPLKDGMTDEAYTFLFRPVMRRVMEIYQPEVVVFQSGAASTTQPPGRKLSRVCGGSLDLSTFT